MVKKGSRKGIIIETSCLAGEGLQNVAIDSDRSRRSWFGFFFRVSNCDGDEMLSWTEPGSEI
jgi:hypothetical protein